MTQREASPDLGRLFCDLVMKGGITSGVVYPAAVAGLARRYRLRSIGGASAGAIAAAAAAAAEHGRQKHGSEAGFRRLEGLAAELGRAPPGDRRGHSLLFHLFAPTRRSRPLFDALAGMLNRRTVAARVALGLWGLLRSFPLTVALGLVLLLACAAPLCAALASPGASAWAWLWGVPALAALIVAAALGVLLVTARRALALLARVLSEQDFGLCTGRREDGGSPFALTDWLHGLLQELAGESAGTPLTFGDLRRLRFAETPGDDGVVLRLMTTCLTLGRPYTLPIGERLYFDPAELSRYFPAEVVAWMERQSWRPRGKEDEQADAFAAGRRVDGIARPLLPIPEPDDFPVLVAVRMSLSFPLLLSAIPLHRYGVRREQDPSAAGRPAWTPSMERLVFTDGGVCSNLPIHLFDSPMPRWPTFGINLRDDLAPGAAEADRVVSPDRGRRYQGERYEIGGDASLGAVASFLGAIVQTMQNWRDMLQRAAPGFRERVYTVRHTSEEGGLNLDMPPAAIARMAESGARAAAAITGDYLAPAGTPPAADDWEYHRWVRLRLLLPTLRTFLGELSTAARAEAPSPTVEELLVGAPPPMGRSHELNQASRAASWALLEELAAGSEALEEEGPDLERTAPRPQGELRVTPRF
jgi:predicted acylesterase/phospholipase RssA